MEWTYTNFEALPHEQLLGLLAGGKGEKVAAVGRSLTNAADKIQDAAEKLKLKSGQVAWEGGSAQAFQSWTSDLVTASFQLTDFTRGVGHNIEIAGNKLTETKNSLPKVSPEDVAILKALEDNPTAGGMFDPVTGVTAHDQAKAAVEGPRLEAAAALRALASTYIASAQVIGALPRPQFRPPPNPLGVEQPVYDREDVGAAAGVVAAAGVAAAGQTSLAGGPSGAGTVTPYTSPANSSVGAWPPPQSTGAPSVVTAGQVTPGTLPPGSNLLGQTPGTAPTQQSVPGQVTGSGPNSSGPTSSVVGRSPVGGLPPTTGQVGATSGGTKGGPVRGGTTGITGGTGGQVRPGTSGSGRSAGPSGLRTGGVEGGTVRPGQMPGAGEARSATSTRTGAPMGGVGAGGAAGATGSTGRTVSGRPPIGTPGGVVGGTGAVPASRGQFSSGGSGLRTGAGQAPAGSSGAAPGTAGQRSGRPMGGAMGAGAATGSDERAHRRRRADYLEEDEETWGGGQTGGAVPPVIG
ncbi:hypothetical protein OG216_30135 [Streptomycetaceae bacterium NBC_01309]